MLCPLYSVAFQHAILHEHVLALRTAQQTAKFRVAPTTMRGQLRFFSAFIRWPAVLYEKSSICLCLPCISSTSRRVSVTAASGAKSGRVSCIMYHASCIMHHASSPFCSSGCHISDSSSSSSSFQNALFFWHQTSP